MVQWTVLDGIAANASAFFPPATGPLPLATSKEGTEDPNQREEVQMERKEVEEVQNEAACEGIGRESEKSSAPLSLSVPFCETGLSPVFLPAYNKAANLLHNKKNIVEAPGNHEGFLVASDSKPTPYFVAT